MLGGRVLAKQENSFLKSGDHISIRVGIAHSCMFRFLKNNLKELFVFLLQKQHSFIVRKLKIADSQKDYNEQIPGLRDIVITTENIVTILPELPLYIHILHIFLNKMGLHCRN